MQLLGKGKECRAAAVSGEERCVTILITAVKETKGAFLWDDPDQDQ